MPDQAPERAPADEEARRRPLLSEPGPGLGGAVTGGTADISAAPAELQAMREGLGIIAESQFRMTLRRFLHHRIALVGLGWFAFLLMLSNIGPRFWTYGYADITDQFATGPSAQHPFGTDTIGHDMFAQVLAGTATSITTAIVVAAIATGVGTLIGAAAGYYGKWADAALMRLTDLVLVVPLLAVLLVLANTLKTKADNWLFIALILAALLWTYLARLVRGTFLSLREREFVEAEHAIGASDLRIILRHMIPNAAGPIVVNATLTVANAILIEAALSFLGLGIQPPAVSLGSLIAAGEGDVTALPWLFYFPAAFLVTLVLSVNFVGDGLRDALDPGQRVRA